MATPLPTIATNTEETAFAVLEGNDLLKDMKVSITEMGIRITSTFGSLTDIFTSFIENLREQQAALLAAAALGGNSERPTDSPSPRGDDVVRDDKISSDLGAMGKLIVYGLGIAAGAIIGWTKTFVPVIKALTKSFASLFNFVTKNKFAGLWARLSASITGIVTSLKTAFTSAISNSVATIRSLFNMAKESKLGQVITAIKNGIARIISPFVKAVTALKTLTGTTGSIGAVIARLGAGIAAIAGSFGVVAKLAGKIFLPITIIMTAFSTIKGAIDGFATGGILGGIQGAITGFFTSLVTVPLDLIKDMVSWLLEKMGFGNAASLLDSFSFTDLYTKMIDAVFGVVQGAIDWLKLLFTNPTEALTSLLTGYIGVVSSIGAFIYDMAIKPAIDWVRGLFGFDPTTMTGEEGIGFISDLVSDAWNSVTQWFTDSLAGITDSLPSWEDITSSIIAALPSWMIPDSFKTPEALANELRTTIADEEARMRRSESGVNEYFGLESSGQAESARKIKDASDQLSEMGANSRNNSAGANINVRGGSSTRTENYAGNSITMGVPSTIGGSRPDVR